MIENDTAGEAMRRLCIGVDLKGYHELDTTDQHEAQKAWPRCWRKRPMRPRFSGGLEHAAWGRR